MKRRSDTTPEPHSTTFFTDRDLDGDFVSHLRSHGVSLERHDDHFPGPPIVTPDPVWIPFVGGKGWIALTHDKGIRYTEAHQRAVMLGKARLFILIGATTHQEHAENFVATLPAIQRFLNRNPNPFVAKIRRPSGSKKVGKASGKVTLWLSYEDWLDRQLSGE